jgi:hypothetical protein
MITRFLGLKEAFITQENAHTNTFDSVHCIAVNTFTIQCLHMYTVSGLEGRGLRLQIPDVSPVSVGGIFRCGCFNPDKTTANEMPR